MVRVKRYIAHTRTCHYTVPTHACAEGPTPTIPPGRTAAPTPTHACPIESACRHLSTYPLGEAAERQRREQDVRTGQGQGEASKAKDAKQAQPDTCAGPKARGSAPPHQHPTQHNVPRRAQSHAGHPSRGTPNERAHPATRAADGAGPTPHRRSPEYRAPSARHGHQRTRRATGAPLTGIPGGAPGG